MLPFLLAGGGESGVRERPRWGPSGLGHTCPDIHLPAYLRWLLPLLSQSHLLGGHLTSPYQTQ